MVTSGSFMTPTPTAAGAVGVKGREATGRGRLALDAGRLGSYPSSGMDDPEVTMPTATVSPTAARCPCPCPCRCPCPCPCPCPCRCPPTLPLSLPLPLG